MNAQQDFQKLRDSKQVAYVALTYTVPDIGKSLTYFSHLGFKESSKSNNNQSRFISDGTLLIELKQGTSPGSELTYYCDDPSLLIKDLNDKGIALTGDNIKTENCTIHIVKAPQGISEQNPLAFIKMKPNDYMDDTKYPNAKCGAYGEISIPVTDLETSIIWWEKLGFKASMKTKQPYPLTIMTDGYIIIGLHQSPHFSNMTLSFFSPDMEPKVKQLRKEGLTEIKPVVGNTDKHVKLTTPGGQDIFLFSMSM